MVGQTAEDVTKEMALRGAVETGSFQSINCQCRAEGKEGNERKNQEAKTAQESSVQSISDYFGIQVTMLLTAQLEPP